MYTLKMNSDDHGYSGGFMSENIIDVVKMLSLDPKLAKQLNLSDEEKLFIAKEDIITAFALNNPTLEVGLLVMTRYWSRQAFELIQKNMDDKTKEEFVKEVNRMKLMHGTFNNDSRSDKIIWDKLSIALAGF